MKRYFLISVAGAALMALSACSSAQLDKAKSTPLKGSPFAQALAKEYIAESEAEYLQGDYSDSNYFAARGEASANGTPPTPEEVAKRDIPADKSGELTAARQRLTTALGKDAANRLPVDAARAQKSFDCWLEQEEEGFQPNDINFCKKQFEEAMAKLEGVPAAKPVAAVTPGDFRVFFDFDKSVLLPKAREIIATAAVTAKKDKVSRILVVGHADRAGSAQHNLGLSGRRAEAVKAELVANGIPAANIITQAKGETQPLVPTADGVAEPQNRRAEISLQKTGASLDSSVGIALLK
jgi:OOP family OmpA-OmpF porin